MGQDTSLPSITPGVSPTTNQAVNQVLIEINRALSMSVPPTSFAYFQNFVVTLRAQFDTISSNLNALTTNNNSVSQSSAINALQASVGTLQGSVTTLVSQVGNNNYSTLQTSLTNLQASLTSLAANVGSISISALSTTVTNNIALISQLQTNLATKVTNSLTINNKALTSNITLAPSDIGLDQVSNLAPSNLPVSTLTQTALSTKVDKLNLAIGATVGSSSNIPVITYNTQGQITNATSAQISINQNAVGLSNVKNVDTTNLSNTSIVNTFSTLNQAISTGDSGFVVAQKTQGQINTKANLVSGTLNNIVQIGSGGQCKDSGFTINDSIKTTTNLLSATGVSNLIDQAVTGVLDIQGSWDASSNQFPNSGDVGGIKKGCFWYVSVPGILGSTNVQPGDSFFATIDTPGQFASNWSIINTNLGFVPENVSNKISTELTNSFSQYPSCFSVKTYVDNAIESTELVSSDATTYYRGDKTWQTLNPTAVGLSNITNVAQLTRGPNDYASFPVANVPNDNDIILFEYSSDGSKNTTTFNNLPLSNATRTAVSSLVSQSTTINGKPLSGNISLTATDVGLGSVSNVPSVQLPINTATQTALNSKIDKINLSSAGSVGSSVSIPVINYNQQGQITSASSVALNISQSQVGLGNVQNVDTTDIQNISLKTALQAINAPIAVNDTGLTIASKTQGQINALIPQIYPSTYEGIPIQNADGTLRDSGKIFDDTSRSTSAIISSAAVDNRIASAIINKFNYRGLHDASTSLYPSMASIFAGDLWIVSYTGTIDSRYIMNGSAIIALSNNPLQQSNNWAILQGSYNFTPLTAGAQDTTSFTLNNFNYPSSSLVKSYVDTTVTNLNSQGQLMPVGAIIAYYGLTAPTGWLLCNGSTFNQSVYPTLYTTLGSATLPDLRNYFLRGKSDSRALGSVESDSTKMPNSPFVTQSNGDHTHNISTNEGIGGSTSVSGSSGTGTMLSTESSGAHTHTISGGDTETRPINFAVNYIIKAA